MAVAGILSQLPGLLSAGQSSGFFDKIKDFAGSVLSDLGSGKVQSGGDFGRSLARGAASALGFSPNFAQQNSMQPKMGMNPQDQRHMALNAELLAKTTNAADHRDIGGDIAGMKSAPAYGRADNQPAEAVSSTHMPMGSGRGSFMSNNLGDSWTDRLPPRQRESVVRRAVDGKIESLRPPRAESLATIIQPVDVPMDVVKMPRKKVMKFKKIEGKKKVGRR